MAVQLDTLRLLPSSGSPTPAAPGQKPSGGAFSDSLNRLLGAVDAATGAANTAVEGMLEGTTDVHDAMIALQRAETTFELTVQMRNKFIQAYQEIMRMPV